MHLRKKTQKYLKFFEKKHKNIEKILFLFEFFKNHQNFMNMINYTKTSKVPRFLSVPGLFKSIKDFFIDKFPYYQI